MSREGSGWSRDVALMTAARGLRSFAYGLMAVLLGVALSRNGFSPAAIGGLITVSLAGDLLATYAVALFADRWGRRRTLVALALVMAATGAVFGLAHLYWALLLAAFLGTLGATASETAPFLPIEQAAISQATSTRRRTDAFARYNLVASAGLAGGALAAGLPDLLVRLGVPPSDGLRLMFGLYAALALLVALIESRLSSAVEIAAAPVEPDRWRRFLPPLGTSRRIVLQLAGLFSVDALAGGLVVQSLMVLFFHLRYGAPLGALGVLFFAANLLSALSFLMAARLAARFGLLNTMVFSHLPAHLLLVVIPFMPSFPLAALVLLARQTLTQMDVPTRQAYTMALVKPEERTAAAGVTSLARSAGSASSPIVSGLLLQSTALTLGLPFLICGALKSVYDLTLWRVFRRVPLEVESGEARAQERPAVSDGRTHEGGKREVGDTRTAES